MPSRGQALTVSFVAWDNTANVGKTGDAANFTLKWVKDGTAATPTNIPATEVDAANAPGLYKIALTGTECTCDFGTLAGKSSTSGVSILPISVSFEQLPTAAPNANGGLPILSVSGTTLGYTVTTVTTVTNQLTAAAIATGVWTDTTAGDFATASSPGKILVTQLGGAFTTTTSSVFSTAALANAPTGGGGGGDTPGTTTLLSRLTATRATNLDNLDVAVSTRSTFAGGAVASVTAAVTISTSQTLGAARALDAIADTSLTVNDALHCAIAAAAGKESISGTTYLVKTPSTGTTLRTFTLDSGSAPTSRT
jgi:trimeric autotransporter adhesin